MTMKLISSAIVSGSPADISITGIPQTYTDLQIIVSARARTTANPNSLVFYVNGYAQTAKSYRFMRGNGGSVNTGTGSETIAGDLTDISDIFNSVSIYIPNYTSSTTKIMVSQSVTEGNTATGYSAMWMNKFDSSAISSVQFGDGSVGGGLGVGSQVWVYGILKGSGGATVS